jgi:hypothetical protein
MKRTLHEPQIMHVLYRGFPDAPPVDTEQE